MHEVFIGAAYYPEMWDESEVEKDIYRCKETGVNVLRVGEFAWGKMEPKEGEFHFEWLKKVVNKLYENGIYTVMCTPSATPPRWLLNKYEETRMVTHDLIRADVSSRCHTCKTSSVMRKKNAIIVTEMAKAFLDCEGIIGWQIDNEIFPYNEGCHCENCKSAFRTYLKKKYGTVENMNKKWGMTRWSLCYDSFEDVQPPYPRQWRHPSLRKAWWDFQCGQIKSYVEEQAEILHSFGYKNVGTDMMAHNTLSYNLVNEKLDVVQFNHYNPAKDLANTAFSYDFLRSIKDKPFWVMETQVGWNGSEFADCGYRPQGACYANTMLPIAMGAEMNMYWLFRTHPNGHEMAHGALYSPAGRMYNVSNEVALAAKHVQKCKDFLLGTKVCSKIALNYSATAVNSLNSAPLIKGLDYRQLLVENYHSAFRHYNVDVIDTQHSLDGYEVLISPFLVTVDENGMKERVLKWVNEGGTWIVGPMSDVMDDNVSRYTQSAYSFLEDLAGVYVKYQKPVDNDVFKAQWIDGDDCSIGVCFDAFECNQGTQSLASYTVGEFAPLSVVAERKVGKGKVVLVGSVICRQDILKLVGRQPIAQASDNVILTERRGETSGIIAVETENKQGYVILDGTYTDLISGHVLTGKVVVEPYQTLVLKR